jgi:hypothetical protein
MQNFKPLSWCFPVYDRRVEDWRAAVWLTRTKEPGDDRCWVREVVAADRKLGCSYVEAVLEIDLGAHGG